MEVNAYTGKVIKADYENNRDWDNLRDDCWDDDRDNSWDDDDRWMTTDSTMTQIRR
ncbi:MAG: hypothetical protein ACLVG5_06390 [Clostridium sp.]